MNPFALLKTLPPDLRRRGIFVALTVPVRAGLDFLGLAALLPVLLTVMNEGDIASNPYLGGIYRYFGFTSPGRFATAVCGVALGMIVVKNLLTLLLARSQSRYMLALYRYFSLRLFRTYYRRGLQFIKNEGTTRLMHQVNQVCYAFAMNVLLPLLTVGGELTFLAMLLGALLFFSPAAAGLAAVCFLPVAWLYTRLVKGRLEAYGRQENAARRQQSAVTYQAFRGFAEMEIGGAYPQLERRFRENLRDISRSRRRTDTLLRIPSSLSEAAVAGVILVIVAVGPSPDSSRMLFGVFAVAALRLLPSVRAILGGWAQIKNNFYTTQIIAGGLAEKEEPARGISEEPLKLQRELRAEDLSFVYPGDRKAVLKNFNLAVRRGERVGLRGVSGGGKTTLFNLLLGLLSPTEGRILIDGRPLDSLARRAWQDAVGYVPQEVFIADDTLAGNVALGCEEPDREKIVRILRQVKLGDWLDGMPDGIDTPMGENGTRASGGQKQRIGIARALYKDASVLFFDEATSALDNETEKGITRAIADISAERADLTILVIAHRESSLDFCDRIIDL